jgi:hypothetical protein
MSSGFGGPPPGVSLLDYYAGLRPPPPPPPPPSTYQSLNTDCSQKPTTLPLPVDRVAGGCWVGDSERNQNTIFDFISGEGNDELEVVVFLAGHAGIINPHQSAGEPKFPIGCYTCYFNYAGELSFTPGSAQSTSDEFMSMLTHEASMSNPFNKKRFIGFLERFKQTHITSGSPLSLYAPSTQMDDSNVLCSGGIAQQDIDFSRGLMLRRNPASALMFVKHPRVNQVVDLTTLNPAIINMWQHTRGNLNVHHTADGRGYQFDIAPYMYLNPDGITFRNVRLSDIYELLKVAIRQMRPDTTNDHVMDEFMNRHVVLVSLGCRVLGNGTVHRVQSVPRPDSVSPESFASGAARVMYEGEVADLHERGFAHWPLPTPGSGSRSSVSVPRPGGGKKKQRRRQTRKYKLSKKSKRSKKHSSKRR